MSKVSTRRRNRITLALGAFSMLTFGSLYGMIASNAAVGQSTAAVDSVNGTAQTTALVLTDLPATAITAAPTPATAGSNSSATTTAVAAAPASTAAPTPAPTAAPTQAATTTHTTSRGS
jgi:hypothetical protein